MSADKNEYIISSCKYINKVVGTEELELLKKYAQVFAKGTKYYFYMFSKKGFSKDLIQTAEKENVKLVTLKDLYNFIKN